MVLNAPICPPILIIKNISRAGNPIKMSNYKDSKTRGDIPDLDEHRKKIIEEFCN